MRNLMPSLVVVTFVLLPLVAMAMTEKGILYLDSMTFKKIVDGSWDILVRFDRDDVYGDEHDAFKEVGRRVGESNQPVLVAAVPVAARELDSKNWDLAVRYQADDSTKYPVYVIFKKGMTWRDAPLRYPDSASKTASKLLSWLAHNTMAFFGPRGQIKELHNLAHALMVAPDPEARSFIAARAGRLAAEITDEDMVEAAKYYAKVFAKAGNSPSYPVKEYESLSRLLEEKMPEERRSELQGPPVPSKFGKPSHSALQMKINILGSFDVHLAKARAGNSEL